ncbi:MAG: DUF488 domain-containing protein [Bacteroidales bacterium]|jgi:uncharacterized protein (DUF488 family)|nr:DUF488 domain-containing protein [Bacteroidales bacterium]
MDQIYTIGCSTHTIEGFLNILGNYNIDTIVDVRSIPFSRYTPQFNQDNLEKMLSSKRIHYLDFSEEFGARRKEKEVYSDGIVDFNKVRTLDVFLRGITRIEKGISKNYRIALLCTEKDPINCHRSLLVSRTLSDILKINIRHILFDGNIIEHHNFEQKMLKLSGLETDMFMTDTQKLLNDAYEIFSKKVAYKDEEDIDE